MRGKKKQHQGYKDETSNQRRKRMCSRSASQRSRARSQNWLTVWYLFVTTLPPSGSVCLGLCNPSQCDSRDAWTLVVQGLRVPLPMQGISDRGSGIPQAGRQSSHIWQQLNQHSGTHASQLERGLCAGVKDPTCCNEDPKSQKQINK